MVFGLPWSHAFFYIGFAGLLICSLFSVTRLRDFTIIIKTPVVFWALCLFVWIAAGMLYTSAPTDLAMYDLKKYRKLLLLPILLFVFIQINSEKYIVLAYVIGVFTLMSFTLIDGFHIDKLLNIDITQYKDQSYSPLSLVYWRNHIVHGFHVSSLFTICVLTAIYQKKLRLFCILLSCVCIYDILLFIHSRSALLGLGVSVLILMYFTLENTKKRLLGLVLVTVFFGALIFLSAKLQLRLISIVSETTNYFFQNNVFTSGGNRLYFWSKSFELFQQAPIFGSGLGSFRDRMLQPDILIPNLQSHHAHNEYITLMSQHGLVGLFLFCAFIAAIYQKAKYHPDKWLGRVVIVFLAIFLTSAVTDSSLHNESEGWTLVIIACLVSIRQYKRTESNLKSYGYFGRYLTATAIKCLTQPLNKKVLAVKPLDYVLETGASRIIQRFWYRKTIFLLGGQHLFQKHEIDKKWKRGLFLYFGENQIGDALMDLAPRTMLSKYGLSVDLLTTPHIAELYSGDLWFSAVHSDPRLLTATNYDFAIVLNNKRRSLTCKRLYFNSLPWLSIHENYFGPDFFRAGFVAQKFADFLHVELQKDEFFYHSRQKLVFQASVSDSTAFMNYSLSAKSIVICVGGVDATRTYLHWGKVLERVSYIYPLSVILLGSANGVSQAEEMAVRYSETVHIQNYVGKTTIAQVQQLMANCQLVACADGGLMHLAATTQVALVALFSNAIDPQHRLILDEAYDMISSPTIDVNDIPVISVSDAILRRMQSINSIKSIGSSESNESNGSNESSVPFIK